MKTYCLELQFSILLKQKNKLKIKRPSAGKDVEQLDLILLVKLCRLSEKQSGRFLK